MEQPTTIATLTTAYVRAYEAINANEDACLCKIEVPEKLARQQATAALIDQSDLLGQAMLREMPTNSQDLLLVAHQAVLALDAIAEFDLGRGNDAIQALMVMADNLVAFLSRQDAVSIPDGWLAKQMQCAIRRSDMRNGVREAA